MRFLLVLVVFVQCVYAEMTPLRTKLEEEKLVRIQCPASSEAQEGFEHVFDGISFNGDELYSYHVRLPKGYYKKIKEGRRYPFLIVDSPNGNAQRYYRMYEQWVRDNACILILLEDARNSRDDAGHKKTLGNYISMMYDIRKRFRIAKKSGVMTGSSGGSRRATFYSSLYPDMMGGVLHSGGTMAGHKLQFVKNGHMFSATYAGDVCFNVGEASLVAKEMGDRAHFGLYAAGHSWVPKRLSYEGLDWLYYRMSKREEDKLSKDVVISYLLAQMRKLKTEESIAVKKQGYDRLQEIMLSRIDELKGIKRCRKVFHVIKLSLAELKKEKDYKNEMIAKRAFDKFYRDYSVVGHCHAVYSVFNYSFFKKDAAKLAQLIEPNRLEAVKKMQSIIDRYPNTYGAKLAEGELKRLESLKTRVLRAGA